MSAEPIPHFLTRLGLGLEADARDIRRSYARELKLVDQENDLPAFQALREAYEVALKWAAWEAERKEQEALELLPEAPAAAAGDGLEALDIVLPPAAGVSLAKAPLAAAPRVAQAPGVDTGALALTVFERFAQAYKTLSQGRILDDVGLWETELRRRLDDEELVNLEARTIFEARIAHLLASEWNLANAPLCSAADRVFAWSGDRRRLQQFGYAGGFVYQALEERILFEAQTDADQASCRRVLARLRAPGMPEKAKLRPDLAHIERMIAHYPNFLALQANPEVVEQWRAAIPRRPVPTPSLAAAVPDNMPEPVLEGDTSRRGFDKAWILFVILGILAIFRAWNGGEFSSPATFPGAAARVERSNAPPERDMFDRTVKPGERPAAARAPLDQKIIDAIGKDIDYQYSLDAPAGQRLVKYDVFLDADGNVLGMNKVSKSMDIDYDKAVEAAIRRAAPYPAEAGTKVSLQFGLTLTKAKPKARKAAPVPEPDAVDTPPEPG